MLFDNNFFDSLIVSFVYMTVYNASLILLFLNLFQSINSNAKTIFIFNNFKLNHLLLFSSSVALFSMAGVPPFTGFFSKLLILVMLTNSNFFFFYVFFFILLFFGLYFYIQNIKFLQNTINRQMHNTFDLTFRSLVSFFTNTVVLSFILIFGFFFFDDFLLYFKWMFV